MCVLLGFLQKTWAIPIMNPLSWFMIEIDFVLYLTTQQRFHCLFMLKEYSNNWLFVHKYSNSKNCDFFLH